MLQLTCWTSVCLNTMLKQWKRNHRLRLNSWRSPRIELPACVKYPDWSHIYWSEHAALAFDLSCVLIQDVLWSPEFCCFLDITGSSSRIQEAPHDFYLAANRKVNLSRTIYKNDWLHLGQWQDWNTFLSSFDFFTFILIFFPEIMLYLPLPLSFKY